MATIISSQHTVTTTPTRIAWGLVGASHVYLHAPAGGNEIFIGNGNVTTTTGFAIPKNSFVEIWLPENDQLFAVVASGTELLYVLHTGGR